MRCAQIDRLALAPHFSCKDIRREINVQYTITVYIVAKLVLSLKKARGLFGANLCCTYNKRIKRKIFYYVVLMMEREICSELMEIFAIPEHGEKSASQSTMKMTC
jgi:hypothetical protein